MKEHAWLFRPLTFIVLLFCLFGIFTHNEHVKAREQATITLTTLQNAQTTGNGTTLQSGAMSQCRETAIYVAWGAGTNAGVVTIESSYDAANAGTWAPLATSTWSVANKQDIIQITGIHANLRARISTNVTGGTVSVFAICN